MLYLGEQVYMESWGAKYDFQTGKDQEETNGTVQMNQLSTLVDENQSSYLLRKNAKLVEDIYGGIHVKTKEGESRITYLSEEYLQIGDIVVYDEGEEGNTDQFAWIYLGNHMMAGFSEQGIQFKPIDELLESMLAKNQFALLRPAKQYTLQKPIIQLGDVNQDDEFNLRDLSTLVLHLVEDQNYQLTGLKKQAADVNEDGEVDLRDLSILVSDLEK